MARACFPSVSQFPIWETLFPVSALLFSRCKLCLRYTAGNFNENPSMRALEKFCEHERASTHVIFASNSSKGQMWRALSNWMGPFDTPPRGRAPFGQHQESNPLGRSNFRSMRREFVSSSQPFRFVRLDSEYAQSDGKSVECGVLPRGRNFWC